MTLDFVEALNQRRLATVNDPEIASRIASYEMADKMQTSVPNLIVVRSEPESIHKLYGTTTETCPTSLTCTHISATGAGISRTPPPPAWLR